MTGDDEKIDEKTGGEEKRIIITSSSVCDDNDHIDAQRNQWRNESFTVEIDKTTTITLEQTIIQRDGSTLRIVVINIVSGFLAVASLPIYFDGDENVDITELLSAVISNFFINYWAGVTAGISGFSSISLVRTLVSFCLAIIITAPSFEAEYLLGSGVLWKSISEYLGNFSLNWYALLTADIKGILSLVLMPLLAPINKLVELCKKGCGDHVSVEKEQALELARNTVIKQIGSLREKLTYEMDVKLKLFSPMKYQSLDVLAARLASVASYLNESKEEKSPSCCWSFLSGLNNFARQFLGYIWSSAVLASSFGYGCAMVYMFETKLGTGVVFGNLLGHGTELPTYFLSLDSGYQFFTSMYNLIVALCQRKLPKFEDVTLTVLSYLVASRSGNPSTELLKNYCGGIANPLTEVNANASTVLFNGYYTAKAFFALQRFFHSRSSDPLVQRFTATDEILEGMQGEIKNLPTKEFSSVLKKLSPLKKDPLASIVRTVPLSRPSSIESISSLDGQEEGVENVKMANINDEEKNSRSTTVLNKIIGDSQVTNLKKLGLFKKDDGECIQQENSAVVTVNNISNNTSSNEYSKLLPNNQSTSCFNSCVIL